jgi:hypothetical protein
MARRCEIKAFMPKATAHDMKNYAMSGTSEKCKMFQAVCTAAIGKVIWGLPAG